MENKNLIYEALGKLPELVDAINSIIVESEKKDAFLAKIAESKAEAVMSEEGKHEVVRLVKDTVRSTPCSTPDVSTASKLIANAVLEDVKASVEDTIRNKISEMPIKLEHHHTHDTTFALTAWANELSKKWIFGLCVLCALLSATFAGFLVNYCTSDEYWGKQYMDIACSEYILESEREMLLQGRYSTGILPKEYYENPAYTKNKIKQNKMVIKGRCREAKSHDGKWSAKIPVER